MKWLRLLWDIIGAPFRRHKRNKNYIEIDENHPVLGQTIKDLFEVYADEVIKIG